MINEFLFGALIVFQFVLTIIASKGYADLNKSRIVENIGSNVINEAFRISGLIRRGGFTCLFGQYQYLFMLIPGLLFLFYMFLGKMLTLGFITGLLSSLSIVYFTLDIATKGNIATALNAIFKTGVLSAFEMALSAGRTASLFITGHMSLVVIMSIVIAYYNFGLTEFSLGCALGGGLISIFARLAGGVFTKSADIAGDMIGKVLLDLPEDSPNNPAVIADNIGDNIGDCVGTAADVFETYLGGMLLQALFPNSIIFLMALFSTICASIISIFSIRLHGLKEIKKEEGRSVITNRMVSIFRNALLISSLIFLIFGYLYYRTDILGLIKDFTSFSMGSLLLVLLLLINWYYVSQPRSPVKRIYEASDRGAAMNIITGLSLSLEAAFITSFIVITVCMINYYFNGIRGLIISLFTLLGFIPCVMTMDSYGPIVDNAGGIVVMANAPKQARYVTDILDALGNLSKALSKGYSAGLTILTSILLLYSLITKTGITTFSPWIIMGIFLGAGLTYVFSSIVINAVYKGADYMSKVTLYKVKNENPENPEYYTQPVKFLALKSVQYSSVALLVIIIPITLFALFYHSRFAMTSNLVFVGLLLGMSSSGLILGLMMTIGGAAWDNAKKLIESSTEDAVNSASQAIENILKLLDVYNTKPNKPQYDLETLESFERSLKALIPDSTECISNIDKLRADLKTYVNTARINQKLIDEDYRDYKKIDFGHCIELLENGHMESNKKNSLDDHQIYNLFIALRQKMENKKTRDAGVIGDIIGDPLKDAAGVALNSLVKLSITSFMVIIWCLK